ncbi:MAG: Uma2 family endonuclease [Planctomycetes bacterium]|nr:Uma2 family endonuclease [Planctomycetota bacterium]
MKMVARSGPYTYDDFCALVREDQKADLIDGVIYLASPESTDLNALFVWLSGLIAGFAEYHDLGKVFALRVAVRLDDKNAPEPDVVFVHKDHLSRVGREWIAGPCDLAIEIVSPDSVERDYEKKRKQYERYGIPEYWIIDEELEKVTLYRLGLNKKYREVKPRKGELRSEVLAGFWLRPEWIWQQPRRPKADVFNEILSRR